MVVTYLKHEADLCTTVLQHFQILGVRLVTSAAAYMQAMHCYIALLLLQKAANWRAPRVYRLR